MNDEVVFPQKAYRQILTLLDELVADSLYQDSLDKKRDSIKCCGESFMTSKLKLIKETLENED